MSSQLAYIISVNLGPDVDGKQTSPFLYAFDHRPKGREVRDAMMTAYDLECCDNKVSDTVWAMTAGLAAVAIDQAPEDDIQRAEELAVKGGIGWISRAGKDMAFGYHVNLVRGITAAARFSEN